MSGRCVPPEYGSFMAKTSPGSGSRSMMAATASGIAPRWTGMCSAWATMRPSRVEERRRAVAPLLDVRRVGAPDQDGPHLLGDARQGAGQHREGYGIQPLFAHLSLQHERAYAVHSPRHQPGLTTQVDSLNSTIAGPSTSEPSPIRSRSSTGTSIHSPSKFASRAPASARLLAAGSVQLGFLDGDRGDEAQVHELDGLVVHPVAVALLVRGVEALLQLLERSSASTVSSKDWPL